MRTHNPRIGSDFGEEVKYSYHNLGGLGALLYEVQSGLRYPSVFVVVALLSILGLTLETLLDLGEAKVVKWRPGEAHD